MGNVRRIYVERKPGLCAASRQVLGEVKNHLAPDIKSARLLRRYDVESEMDEADWKRMIMEVFSNPATDDVYVKIPPNDGFAFTASQRNGQYDQRAHYAAECVRVALGAVVTVKSSLVYIFEGEIGEGEKNKIKKYYVNPVDTEEIADDPFDTLQAVFAEPKKVARLDGFAAANQAGALEIVARHGIAMDACDVEVCRKYFCDEGRDPTVTELKALETYWSDHCRHTTFNTELCDITFEDCESKKIYEDAYNRYLTEREFVYGAGSCRPVTLMDIAVMGMKSHKKRGLLGDLDESGEVNACSINVKVDVDGVCEDWLLQFKNETHNHPTEIEPVGGATTCLGGAIRDPMSGRAFVYQAMRVTGSGDPTSRVCSTKPGKHPQRWITKKAAEGYASYGNVMGLPAGHIAEIYHPGYEAKRMELGALVAAVKKSEVRREEPTPGDVVILVGGKTGRDGCGGASSSSTDTAGEKNLDYGAEVPKGDPAVERGIVRLFDKPEAKALIKRCNDFGAGGVSVAVGEIAEGLMIDLDAVPTAYGGLDGTDLAISESQERMAVVVASRDANTFLELARAQNLEATPIAKVTGERRVTMRWRGDEIFNISRDFLDSAGARRKTCVVVGRGDKTVCEVKEISAANWLDNLREIKNAGQTGLIGLFDSAAGAGTVLNPLCGKNKLT
ncbi:MAG: AIR synthase-related protein, partial [Defluviitaleaceae bacterium]|nr:AIR synthase-related protein [Defluviitaleaceae bacterium]